MRITKAQTLYHVVLIFPPHGATRTVRVKAATREVAEQRALKRNRRAIGVSRDA